MCLSCEITDMAVQSVPAPGGGPLLLLLLNIMENLTGEGEAHWNSTQLYHCIVEVGQAIVFFCLCNQIDHLLTRVFFHNVACVFPIKFVHLNVWADRSWLSIEPIVFYLQAMKFTQGHQSVLGDLDFVRENITRTLLRLARPFVNITYVVCYNSWHFMQALFIK